MELLAVGDLWVFLLIFPATNTTSDEARLSLVHVGELVPYTGPLCRQGAFLCRKHSPLFFLLLPFLSKKPASMTMFWSCVPPQICDSDFAPQLCYHTQTSSSTCSLLKLCAVVYLPLFGKPEYSLVHGLLQHVLPLYLHCFLLHFDTILS